MKTIEQIYHDAIMQIIVLLCSWYQTNYTSASAKELRRLLIQCKVIAENAYKSTLQGDSHPKLSDYVKPNTKSSIFVREGTFAWKIGSVLCILGALFMFDGEEMDTIKKLINVYKNNY